jgi:hypothetical protein
MNQTLLKILHQPLPAIGNPNMMKNLQPSLTAIA